MISYWPRNNTTGLSATFITKQNVKHYLSDSSLFVMDYNSPNYTYILTVSENVILIFSVLMLLFKLFSQLWFVYIVCLVSDCDCDSSYHNKLVVKDSLQVLTLRLRYHQLLYTANYKQKTSRSRKSYSVNAPLHKKLYNGTAKSIFCFGLNMSVICGIIC